MVQFYRPPSAYAGAGSAGAHTTGNGYANSNSGPVGGLGQPNYEKEYNDAYNREANARAGLPANNPSIMIARYPPQGWRPGMPAFGYQPNGQAGGGQPRPPGYAAPPAGGYGQPGGGVNNLLLRVPRTSPPEQTSFMPAQGAMAGVGMLGKMGNTAFNRGSDPWSQYGGAAMQYVNYNNYMPRITPGLRAITQNQAATGFGGNMFSPQATQDQIYHGPPAQQPAQTPAAPGLGQTQSPYGRNPNLF